MPRQQEPEASLPELWKTIEQLVDYAVNDNARPPRVPGMSKSSQAYLETEAGKNATEYWRVKSRKAYNTLRSSMTNKAMISAYRGLLTVQCEKLLLRLIREIENRETNSRRRS